jgi:hypothetical protein
LVCLSCVEHFVQENVYGQNKSEISCFSEENCPGFISSATLDRVFSPKSRKKVDEQMFRIDVEKASISDLW